LDFAKAFDKVPHQRLLSKLKSHGISGRVLDWIENWLSGRVQRVQVKGVKSFWESVTSGVPQGSGLGPVLFLIYINDLDEDILRLILKFADDTKIFSTIQSEVDAANLQRDIDKLLEWSEIWQMNFKVTKCKVMHIGKQYSEHQYSMNGHILETVTEEKDLGILLTKYRKVAQQCSKAYARANRMAGLIKRNIENKDKKIMLRLYKSLVRPHVDYCSSAWSSHYKKNELQIEKVQRRFTKIIPELREFDYETRSRKLNLWSLEERRNHADVVEVFKMLNDSLQYRLKPSSSLT